MRGVLAVLIGAMIWLCGGGLAQAKARDDCVNSGIAMARLAFPRVALDAPAFPGVGPPEMKLGPALGGGYLSISDMGRKECDLTVNIAEEAGEPNDLFLRLTAEAAAGALGLWGREPEIAALVSRCLASRPRKYDENNDRDGLRQHKHGISVECQSSLLYDRMQTTTLTIYLRDDEAFYKPSGLEDAPECLATSAKRLAEWAASKPDLTFDEAYVDRGFAWLKIAAGASTPETLFKTNCVGMLKSGQPTPTSRRDFSRPFSMVWLRLWEGRSRPQSKELRSHVSPLDRPNTTPMTTAGANAPRPMAMVSRADLRERRTATTSKPS